MNWIDIVILVVWALTSGWGYTAGLIQMVIPLATVIVGLAIASRIGDTVGNAFSSFTDNEDYQSIAGFILIFVGLFIIASIAGFVVRTVLRFIPLSGMVNKLAGLAAGLIIGFVLLSGVMTGVQKFQFNDQVRQFDDSVGGYLDGLAEDIDDSALGTFLADNFDVVIRGVGLIPGDWDNQLENLVVN
ncbi:MAG: hypothetical protein BZY88_18130 [SAR202 cluster bacterium Io17-Chloro-G9]|nr:MAG: hypothetical protein BZY88_18130 [SAR202 cluster bacterium Io17-Chloro-G9]